jgi:HAE1 family hydrophobic/amphiphilic exporter-1
MIALVVERSPEGERVPLSKLTTINSRVGPEFTQRLNEYRSAQRDSSAAPEYNADHATTALEEVFKQTESLLQWSTELRFAWLHL